MTETVGTMLWQLRTAGGWTLGKLAQKAGVSKSALSQWETGKRQPRVDELQAVLEALDAPASQRALVFARIPAPRAIRHLRQQEKAGESLVAPPTAGDLLQAMRLRKRWSQESLATHMGVDRKSVGRWERGERLPDSQQLHSLCYVLDAHEEELLALTQGQFSHASPEFVSLHEEDQEQLLAKRMEELLWYGGDLVELRWLVLERDVWQLAMKREAARPLLMRILVGHAWHNRNQEQWSESEKRVQRAFAVMPHNAIDTDIRIKAVLMSAACKVHAGKRLAPERGSVELQKELEYSTEVKLTAWMLADMAQYAAMAGQVDASLVLAKRACQTAERSELLTEMHLRRCDYGSLLLKAGRPEDALNILPPVDVLSEWAQINTRLLLVEVHRQLGHFCEAHDQLQQVFGLIANHHEMEFWRPKADMLAQRF